MILEVKNVEYAYKSQKERKVLDNISVRFEEKKLYSIIGASGAGKTTLLSLLAGLDKPTKGTVLYEGEDILAKGLDYHRKNHVSLVFQEYNLIDYLTTEENVKLGGTDRPEELLSKVNIPKEEWKRNVMKLSGGQQQRVAIARALASKAKVLLADEPTGSVKLVQHYPKIIPVTFPALSTFISSMTDRQRVRFSSRDKVSYIALKSAVKYFLTAAKSGGASCARSGSCPSAAVYIS